MSDPQNPTQTTADQPTTETAAQPTPESGAEATAQPDSTVQPVQETAPPPETPPQGSQATSVDTSQADEDADSAKAGDDDPKETEAEYNLRVHGDARGLPEGGVKEWWALVDRVTALESRVTAIETRLRHWVD